MTAADRRGSAPAVMRLRVALRDVKPTPWRRLEVGTAATLADLHAALQAVMGWENLHLHVFRILGRGYDPGYADLGGVRLADLRLRAGERFTYEYNLAVPWRHEIRVEAVGPGVARRRYPRCTDGRHAAPPEWCPGPEALDEARADLLGLTYVEDLDLMVEFGRAVLDMREGRVRDALDTIGADDLRRALARHERREILTTPFDRHGVNATLCRLMPARQGSRAMTMRFTRTLTTEVDGGDGGATKGSVVAVIERDALAPETLGLTLAEAKALLATVQAAVVEDQITLHAAAARPCAACGADRRVRGHRPLTCRTAFGTVRIEAERLRRCGCGADPAAGDRGSFSPLADLLPERTAPELLYLETRWGSLVSYGMAARLLGDVLPLEQPVAPERVRRHLHAVAEREERALIEEPDIVWSGCGRDLDAMPLPNGPAYVGVDGGFVRDRAGSWFEVTAGKCVPGFRRDAPEDEEPRPGKCFAFVQTHDERPRQRLLGVLAAQGHTPNQRVVLMSDGGDSVRRLLADVGPEAERVLDWFHVTMRLTVLVQTTKGACPDRGWTEGRLRDLERLKWLLWHGHARHAVEAADGFADDAWGMEGDTEGEAKTKLGRLHRAAEEFATYLRNNAGQIVDYGERHRAGDRISTGFVESAVNQVVSKRFAKRQSMRWTQRGAHLALQTRSRVLNGELEDVFRRRWPAFRPAPMPASLAGNCSFA